MPPSSPASSGEHTKDASGATYREHGGSGRLHAAFYAGDYPEAQSSYERSLRFRQNPDEIYLKLSDVHFKLGNLDLERVYREKIYGSLRP